MNARDFPNGFLIKDKEQQEELVKDFDIVFIEKVNKGYDKSLKNTMFHWVIDKLYDLKDDGLLWFSKENESPLTMSTFQMHSFVKGQKGSVVMIEKEGGFITANHKDYIIDYGDNPEDEKEAELF